MTKRERAQIRAAHRALATGTADGKVEALAILDRLKDREPAGDGNLRLRVSLYEKLCGGNVLIENVESPGRRHLKLSITEIDSATCLPVGRVTLYLEEIRRLGRALVRWSTKFSEA
jgi:hypothetical protein